MQYLKPIRKQGLVKKRIGGETLLYDVQAGAIHILNKTADLIWDLCDGRNSVEDMLKQLHENFSVGSEHDLSSDLSQALSNFNQKGLLQNTRINEAVV